MIARSYRFGCLAVLAVLSLSAAQAEAKSALHTRHREAQAKRRSVVDYFYLLPSLGNGYQATRREKRLLLQAENHPIIDVRHDYLLVHPDSSPEEQIAVFRVRNKADLLAVSQPDFESDYNQFTLFRLQNGRLRDVTRQMLPMPTDTNRFLYELPRFGTTIRVYKFHLETQSRRHVFDLQWRGDRFVRVRSAATPTSQATINLPCSVRSSGSMTIRTLWLSALTNRRRRSTE